MPLYDYECKECGHKFEEQLKIAERHYPTEEPCPSCSVNKVEQYMGNPPRIGDPIALGVHRNPSEFVEVIQKIKEDHPLSPLNYTGKADKYT